MTLTGTRAQGLRAGLDQARTCFLHRSRPTQQEPPHAAPRCSRRRQRGYGFRAGEPLRPPNAHEYCHYLLPRKKLFCIITIFKSKINKHIIRKLLKQNYTYVIKFIYYHYFVSLPDVTERVYNNDIVESLNEKYMYNP